MTSMTEPIPSAGETTIIGLPAIQFPVTSAGDRPLTQEDLETITRLSDNTALLISTRGALSGSRYLLDEDQVTVGRDPRSDILLDDSTVSRAHAVFRRVNGRYEVVDAGSLNGTYVNRQRVDQAVLNNGDEIMIGKFRLVYFTKSAIRAQ
ncbi:putative oxoglutarate dehydrogenase inhibitor [Bifidobacterium cuniculi]|uniref:Putative oxoglutarate dehydrogenase inhibitor n=2 Tax=Bifidobacterium cuniculi TaxID=1688 RepID=A0A087AW04_9BIFI|nr:putative oxoglutarate dehydrogenase inhibitor [Bifidobacterium cuniculi]